MRKEGKYWVTTGNGAARFNPEVWEYINNVLTKYGLVLNDFGKILKVMLGNDETAKKDVAAAINTWEFNLLSQHFDTKIIYPDDVDDGLIASTTVMSHYVAND